MASLAVILRRLRWLLAVAAAVLPLGAAERAYWVWQRGQPLSAAESEELHRQEIKVLYWHVATIDEKLSAQVVTGDLAKMAPGFHTVPVVRVETNGVAPRAEFLRLKRFAKDGALQLDFDSPDRKLGEYAARLAELRAEVPHLGITALAHWPAVKDFPALARSVEEICPMFYDLQADPTGVSAQAGPPPLLNPAQVEKLLADWKACPTRWRAGLPVFTRITIFDDTGVSRGQIPAWEWDEVAFNKHLRTAAPTQLGVTLLRADANTKIARRAIPAGETVVVRTTDRGAFHACVALAEKIGAAGVVIFRLPAPDSGSTWSLRAIGGRTDAQPRLMLRREGDALILGNDGEADLTPRLSGDRHDRDRGYELEVDAPAPVFREAEMGEFFHLGSHAGTEKEPQAVPVPVATRLTFWFSQLSAGARLRSGIFQLAPGADLTKIRWRVNGSDWQPFPNL